MVKRDPCWRKVFPATVFPDKCCNVLCCCCPIEEQDENEEVVVYMNDPAANAEFEFPSNYVRTSKYSIITFLPLGLFFQFQKASNLYFLVNMIFSLIPGVAPISPATAIAPLVFVLVVALIKEGIEDIKRHQADNRANSLPAEVLRGTEMSQVPSRDVQVGDIIRISIGEEVRADVVLFASSLEEGQAFIDTCSLDGETNLKSRKAQDATWHLVSPEAFQSLKGVLRTGPPDPGLLSWNGLLELDGTEVSLSLDQFLYRGSILRNTEWIWGMVAYAGVDTKMFRNLKDRPPKSSTLDKKLNILIVIIFILQNVLLFIICSLAVWFNNKHSKHWYMKYYLDQYKNGRLWGYRYLTYFILLSYLIPISLFVTTEVCKVIQAQWMRVDCEMMEFMVDRWRHCQPNTSNLNEQLAMVRFIFSDKTGTLTENVMRFKRGDILGTSIDADIPETITRLREPSHPQCQAADEYFLALALCHTIQPFKDETKETGLIYEGSSPDEVALVETAATAGYRLTGRTTRTMTLMVNEKEEKVFKVLATLEFTPNRKMMSIIIEDPTTKKIMLYNKGADSFIKPQLSSAPDVQALMDKTDAALTDMSSVGLRTLLVCARELTPEVFEEWNTKFVKAGKTLVNRADVVDEVCLEIETDLRLLGATAIEDKLQDQVPETLSFFLGAGVIVWMLTGDKRETAVTIAATSTLCDPREDYVDHIDIGSLDAKSEEAVRKVGDDLHAIEQHLKKKGTSEERRCTFVIDGPALGIAMDKYFELFLDLSQQVNSAVCCRLTPIQKANVVRMFQKSTGLTALAIGDGANDVSMIQEGKVGIGIIGLEGAQAALAADYAIPRFKHLRRLCAVHGRYSLVRNASCITVSFYKNIIISVCQVIYACYAGYSGQTLFDGWLLTFYNVIITSIPPFFMGIFEKDLAEEALMERPKLYTPLSRGLYFSVPLLIRWFGEGIFHAFLLFYVSYPTLVKGDGTRTHGYDGRLVGTLVFCGMSLIVLTRFGLNIRYWQWLQVLGMVISLVLFLALVFFYSLIPSLFGDTIFYWQIYDVMSGGKFWFYILFWVGTVLTIDLSARYFQKRLFPTLRDNAERQYRLRGTFSAEESHYHGSESEKPR